MTRWLLLTAAIVAEVCATLSLKAAQVHPGWYVVVALGYASAMLLITACLRAGMPLGVAYGVWAALGVALAAALSAVLFDEPVTPVMGLGIVLVVAGVLVVDLGSHRAQAPSDGVGAEVRS